MGLTWVIGFLVIEVEELFVFAYIFTIVAAFQGLFIFIVLVLLDSKMVRDMLAKWWRARFERSDFYSIHFGQKGHMLGTSLVRVYPTSLDAFSSAARKSVLPYTLYMRP